MIRAAAQSDAATTHSRPAMGFATALAVSVLAAMCVVLPLGLKASAAPDQIADDTPHRLAFNPDDE